jgi:tetratricopeptide (TPR) repeat protein
VKSDLSEDRIKLIYEFNQDSPLFARVAAAEIEKGNYLEAIKILDDGIDLYPNYASAFLVLSIAKAYEGKEEEAKIVAKTGSDLVGDGKTFPIYEKRILEIISERNSIRKTLRHSFVEEKNVELVPEENLVLEDKLDLLAQQLSKAKIIPKEDVAESQMTIPEFKGQKIVSETLAEIYIKQKNFPEAISMYEDLLSRKPEKVEFYLQRISDIKTMMHA